MRVRASIQPPQPRSRENFVTTISVVSNNGLACDQAEYKKHIIEGLQKLYIGVADGSDPTTDVAQDLNGKTILIEID